MSRDVTADIREIQDRKNALIEKLNLLPAGEERLLFLLQMGRKYPAMEDRLKTPERLLPGCISQLWIETDFSEGGLTFLMDADAAISKGIAAAVCGFYNGLAPGAILVVEPDFFEPTGLTSLISPNRSNAVSSLRRFITAAAGRIAAP